MMKMASENNKVILGLSGGVDSTTAALLLKEKGYEVTGLYFDISKDLPSGREKAENAARQIGIDFIYRDASENFKNIVIKDFTAKYMSGKTPNPCVICNPNIKFKLLAEAAKEIGASHIATGHYAGTEFCKKVGTMTIIKAENRQKDQSYMLYRLPEEYVKMAIFPLANIEDKGKVREIARLSLMKNSEEKDSQEICFIDPETTYIDYLKECGYVGKPGDFIDKTGKVLGRHQGIIRYTVGQRKGLGITFGKPMYVVGINSKENTVILGEKDDIFSKTAVSGDNFFIGGKLPAEELEVTVKIRYRAPEVKAKIKEQNDGKVCIIFYEPQRAVTPGQSIIFYLDRYLIGGGIIE